MFHSDDYDVEGTRSARTGCHLFRFFLAVSLVTVVTILSVAGVGLNRVFRANVIGEAEKDAIRISTALRDGLNDYVQPSSDIDGEWTISDDRLVELDAEMRSFLGPFHIVKIKVFNTNTRIVYSTDPKIIGKIDPDNAKLAAALSGRPVSKYETKEHVWDLTDEQQFDVGIVETYVPAFSADGTIIGSFEIYKDVTPDLAQANRTLTRAMVVLSAIVLVVFSILVLIMHRAARTIHRQTAKLALSEEKYRRLFSTVTDAILIFDPQTSQVIDANGAASLLYGYSKADLLARSIEEMGIDADHLSQALLDPSGLGVDQVVQCEHTKADGTVFPAEMSGGCFMTGDREIMFVVVRDITERKQAEAEQAGAMREIERFNSLAVGRESRMLELKREVNELARKAGVAPPYDLAFAEPGGEAEHGA
ncbi:hypothetical protein LCGC14_0124890 [marine sediment metagenome]|uniref:PAS domain-containing protein n=1 Tax=marine sediment metagenome TaxID=412755 RepID=A0A0F9V9M6_9ZZZZ|nr:PAS domain S-box protein [Phycisphaerae bacterium]HDZ45347.1 PAS domain S-box protein [Phycisphaerae bacterium]